MNMQNKLPIALIATVAILAGGGVLYLKIKPGPGKKLDIVQPEKESVAEKSASPTIAEESLTPAEKAAKRTLESYLRYNDLIHRNIEIKEVENDGYEAVVIVGAEIRNEDKEWRPKYRAIMLKLVGNSWSTAPAEEMGMMYDLEQLRSWRDVKVLGFKETRLLPSEKSVGDINCDPEGTTSKAEAFVDIENKGNKERKLKITASVTAFDLVRRGGEGCNEERLLQNDDILLKVPPKTKEAHRVVLEMFSKSWFGACCVYSAVRPTAGIPLIVRAIDGYQKPHDWWLEHPQYVP